MHYTNTVYRTHGRALGVIGCLDEWFSTKLQAAIPEAKHPPARTLHCCATIDGRGKYPELVYLRELASQSPLSLPTWSGLMLNLALQFLCFLGLVKLTQWQKSLVDSFFHLGLFVWLGLLSASVICFRQIVHFAVA